MADPPLTAGRFEAVIFDLFGTLVPEFPRAEFFGVVREAAEILGADPEAFEQEWRRTAVARQTGAYGNGLQENIQVICSAIGLAAPSEEAVDRALAPREEMYRRWFFPRDGAIDTLSELRARGYLIGLISMCAPDTPALWRASASAPLVDVTVFSCETGLRKPDAAIYRRCCEALEVEPSAVLYCGDGSYGELSGAERVGMTAVEIRDPAVDTAAQLRPEAEEWPGAAVADLRDLLAWLPPR